MSPALRNRSFLALAALVLASSVSGDPLPTPAQKSPAPARVKSRVARAEPKWKTLSGEVIDMGCYTARGLKGAIHRDCGTQCVRSGVPKGLLTAGDTVYVLTENHDRAMAPTNFPPPDPFLLCNDWVSQKVEISGLVHEGAAGARLLEVHFAKLVPPAGP